MFDLEFTVKQKAQLKYLQEKTNKFHSRLKLLNIFSHEFLWSPTPVYYAGSFLLYLMVKNRMRLTMIHALPFLAIPPTLDYFKRDFYVNKFGEDRKALNRSVSVVN
jgi:hypothetical protein